MKCELYPHPRTHAYTAVNSSQALTHYPSLSFTLSFGIQTTAGCVCLSSAAAECPAILSSNNQCSTGYWLLYIPGMCLV